MGIFDRIFSKNKTKESEAQPDKESLMDYELHSNHIKSAEFKKIVSIEIAPSLRKVGWKGSGFDYRRIKYGVKNEIKFQGSSGGRKFCINLNTEIELKQTFINTVVNESNIWRFTDRLTPNNEGDYWWELPKRNIQHEKLIIEINNLLEDKVDAYFRKWQDWESNISMIKSNELNSEFANKLFWGSTEFSRQLICSIHNLYVGNKERSIEFATMAKAKIKGNSGVGRLSLINEIIKIASS